MQIKISISQENIMILNMHAPKNSVSKYRKQNLTVLKRETEKSTIIVGIFNIPPQQLTELLERKSARL